MIEIACPTWRYPDKPKHEVHRPVLDQIGPGYLCTLKMDGWRTLITVGPVTTFISRENKPIPVSADAYATFQDFLHKCSVPSGTIFDAEWVSRRPAWREEAIWLFDVLRIGDSEEMYRVGAFDRFDRLKTLIGAERWYVVPSLETGQTYGEFYDANRHRPDAEGVVLKAKNSPYIASVRDCALNPDWLKCKWRAGEDGQTPQ